MKFKEHREELLKDKAVRAEYDKLRPAYQGARTAIQRRIEKNVITKVIKEHKP